MEASSFTKVSWQEERCGVEGQVIVVFYADISDEVILTGQDIVTKQALELNMRCFPFRSVPVIIIIYA